MIKILFLGDIFGEVGRNIIKNKLPSLIKKEKINYVIANGENTTHGRGLSLQHYKLLKSYGINFFTMGNHTWQNNEYNLLLGNNDIVRPINVNNFTNGLVNVGVGTKLVNLKSLPIRITNLMGPTIYNKNYSITNPFVALEDLLKKYKDEKSFHIVDFHAETTAEKTAFLKYFQGKVGAIIGTHTHVQTNDAMIYNSTAYITDVGMNGSYEGIIGANPETIIHKFFEETEHFVLSPDEGKGQLNGIIITINEKSLKPTAIKKVYILVK